MERVQTSHSFRRIMDRINAHLLITLIEERPVIWDKTLDIYKNKILREKAWRDICVLLRDDYEDMDKTDKHEFGKAVLKKWTQVRDSWSKDIKKRKELMKAGTADIHKPYKFSDQLSFLKKVVRAGSEVIDINDDGDASMSYTEVSENSKSVDVEARKAEIPTRKEKPEITQRLKSREPSISSPNIMKRKQDTIDNKMIKFLDNANSRQNEENNPHLHFFKSLLPITATFNVDETLQFQGSVIKLLQNIKRQRQAPNSGYTTIYYQNSRKCTSSQDSPTNQSSPASNLEDSDEESKFANF